MFTGANLTNIVWTTDLPPIFTHERVIAEQHEPDDDRHDYDDEPERPKDDVERYVEEVGEHVGRTGREEAEVEREEARADSGALRPVAWPVEARGTPRKRPQPQLPE